METLDITIHCPTIPALRESTDRCIKKGAKEVWLYVTSGGWIVRSEPLSPDAIELQLSYGVASEKITTDMSSIEFDALCYNLRANAMDDAVERVGKKVLELERLKP